ncbi:MAG: hypothetical protein GX962_08125 [Epulopiscium sp.]|nr:hypothetical protein [Candidatus Epulonipiscium sp.]
MRLFKTEGGTSLIEIIIGWMLTGFLLLLFSTAFIRYLSEFQHLKDETEVQYQVIEVLTRWNSHVLGKKKITRIENEKKESLLHQKGTHQVIKIIFDNNLIFEHQPISQNFLYGTPPSTQYANVMAAHYIDEILITPLPMGVTYADCLGMELTICGKKNKASFSITTEIYFRLYEERVVNALEY